MILNVPGYLKCWWFRLASLLLADHKFNYGITGRKDVNDDACPILPSTSTIAENIEAVKKMILDNHRITIGEFADNANISFSSYQAIFEDVLVMKNAAAKIDPKLQNCEKKQRRMYIA